MVRDQLRDVTTQRASQSYAVLGLSLGRSRCILANDRRKSTGFHLSFEIRPILYTTDTLGSIAYNRIV